jgi:hypothetical protein
MASTGLDDLRADLEFQREFVRSVPSYYSLLALLSDALDEEVAPRLEPLWRGREFLARYERPLLLLGGLRFAALGKGPSGPLYASLVDPGTPEALTREALTEALHDESVWHAAATRKIQTNEVSRAVCWLWVAALVQSRRQDATFALYDVGASAGLNLLGDRLPMPWTDGSGEPLLSGEPPAVSSRVGFEKTPVDPLDTEDARWLAACLWPGQRDRLKNLERALAVARELAESSAPLIIEQANIGDVPSRLAAPESHAIAYQTIVRDYVEEGEFARYRAGMADWLGSNPGSTFWVELELLHDGSPPETSCAITVHVASAPGSEPLSFELGRCHPHPSVIRVRAGEVGRFLATLA